MARAIHAHSPRRRNTFIKVNCAAMPRELLESELFGHERGAFTGAHQRKPGKFELANGGTIFLDEIGELDIGLQPKLLRVLEQREIKRVGGDRTIKVDVRVLAATTRARIGLPARPPTRSTMRSCSTRSSLACAASGSSPISSRKMVPSSAASNLPARRSTPVATPRSMPNSSASSRFSGIAAQLIAMKRPLRRDA